jgi:tetratricopeptide (TPR) repeat protein
VSRLLALGVLVFAAATAARAEFSAAEIEDAADFARRTAMAALRGQHRSFAEVLDADRALARRIGPDVWESLAGRQRERLGAAYREFFQLALGAPRGANVEVGWADASAGATSVDVLLGLKIGLRSLKTRWIVRRIAAGWRISDVVLVDPGISLSTAAVRALGPRPVRRREKSERAAAVALPRLVGILAIASIVFLARRRLPGEKRWLLYATAAAPAILFLVDGVLATARAVEEPFVIPEELTAPPWRQAEQMALQAQREGRLAAARDAWSRAAVAGAPPAQAAYQQGLLARQQGNTAEARSDFERALTGPEPAPGAARELAALAEADGNHAEARIRLETYLKAAGPDPESLSLAAVVEANLGNTAAALARLSQAREMLGEEWKSAELEARVRARAGDGVRAAALLRPLARDGFVDRSALRADPLYLPIATDAAWVAFLNERPTPSPSRTPTPRRS